MHIEINTDNTIEGNDALAAHAKGVIEHALIHFTDRISRVEAHMGEASHGEFGRSGKHCTLEARIEGRNPVTVLNDAATVHDAVTGAATKLKHVLETTFGRLHDARRPSAADNPKN
jgi:hypothetical protein